MIALNYSFLNLNIPIFKEGLPIAALSKNSIAILDHDKYLNHNLLELFNKLNLKIVLVETFFKNRYHRSSIHTDVTGGDFTKLNWVFGCNSSEMCWYKPITDVNTDTDKTMIDTTYISYTRDQTIEIERTVIKNPTLVQVGIPHDISEVTEDRWCISIVFKDITTDRRPTMAESRLIFKDFLDNSTN